MAYGVPTELALRRVAPQQPPVTATSIATTSPAVIASQLSHALMRCSQPDARLLVPEALARRLCVLPLAIIEGIDQERTLVVCSGEQFTDLVIAQELRFVTGCMIELEKADRHRILEAISYAYRASEDALRRAFVSAAMLRIGAEAEGTDRDAIPRLVDMVIDRALALRASDIHLEYNQLGVSLRYRVDGVLRPHDSQTISTALIRNLARCVKVRAGLDITVEHQPQEGAFAITQQAGTVRVSILPVLGGEKLVMRLFFTDALGVDSGLALGSLGLYDTQLQLVRAMLHLAGGVLLFSGPTGSGKSTLLRAALHEIKHESKNIISIEDPVEQVVPHVSHLQVDRARGLDYFDLLAPVLRQDPDVLVVGEIRDAKTAEMVLTAGITGHLVISTVHAGSSLDVLLRLRQFGLPWDLIALSVRLVSSQRLVGLVCSNCATTASVSSEFCSTFSLPEDASFSLGLGCPECLETGVFGRMGLFEFLPLGSAIRAELLSDSSDAVRLGRVFQVAKNGGYEPLPFTIKRALVERRISPNTALSALGVNPIGLV